jgi:hypothetical protein
LCGLVNIFQSVWSTRQPSLSAVENHISELSQRHRVLDQKIEKEQSRPLIDDVKLAELKRKKLQLKDEIKRLELTIN